MLETSGEPALPSHDLEMIDAPSEGDAKLSDRRSIRSRTVYTSSRQISSARRIRPSTSLSGVRPQRGTGPRSRRTSGLTAVLWDSFAVARFLAA
jgi:hypothetical protein